MSILGNIGNIFKSEQAPAVMPDKKPEKEEIKPGQVFDNISDTYNETVLSATSDVSSPYITKDSLKEHKMEYKDPKDSFASLSQTRRQTTHSLNPQYSQDGAINLPRDTSKLVKEEVVLKSGVTITDDKNGEITVKRDKDNSIKKYPGKIEYMCIGPKYRDKDGSVYEPYVNIDFDGKPFRESMSIFNDGDFQVSVSDPEKRHASSLGFDYKGRYRSVSNPINYREGSYSSYDDKGFNVKERDDGKLLIEISDKYLYYGWNANHVIYTPTISAKDLIPPPVSKPADDQATETGKKQVKPDPDHVLLTDKFAKSNSKLSPATKDKNRFLPL